MWLALIIQVSHTPRHVTPVPPEFWELPTVHPTGESLNRTGMGNTDSCIAWSGCEYGSTPLIPQTPIHE